MTADWLEGTFGESVLKQVMVAQLCKLTRTQRTTASNSGIVCELFFNKTVQVLLKKKVEEEWEDQGRTLGNHRVSVGH